MASGGGRTCRTSEADEYYPGLCTNHLWELVQSFTLFICRKPCVQSPAMARRMLLLPTPLLPGVNRHAIKPHKALKP